MDVVRKRLVFPGRSRLDAVLRDQGFADVADELVRARPGEQRLSGQTGRGAPTSTALADINYTALGIISETFPLDTANSQGALTAGDLDASLAPFRKGQIITRIHCALGGAGVGAAPTLIKLGILDLAGNVLAATANDAANAQWTSTGLKEVALTATYQVLADGDLYLAWLRVGNFGTTAEAHYQATGNPGHLRRRSTGPLPRTRVAAQADMVGPFALIDDVFGTPWLAAS